MSAKYTPTEIWGKALVQNKLMTAEAWSDLLALREELGGNTPISQLLLDNKILKPEHVAALEKKVTSVYAQLLAQQPKTTSQTGKAPAASPPPPPNSGLFKGIPPKTVVPEHPDDKSKGSAGPETDEEAPAITGGQTALGSSMSIGAKAARDAYRNAKPLQIAMDGDEDESGNKISHDELTPTTDGDRWKPSDSDWVDDVSVKTTGRANKTDVEQIDLAEDVTDAATGAKPKILRQDDASWSSAGLGIAAGRSNNVPQIDLDAEEETDDPMVPKPEKKKIIHPDGSGNFKK